MGVLLPFDASLLPSCIISKRVSPTCTRTTAWFHSARIWWMPSAIKFFKLRLATYIMTSSWLLQIARLYSDGVTCIESCTCSFNWAALQARLRSALISVGLIPFFLHRSHKAILFVIASKDSDSSHTAGSCRKTSDRHWFVGNSEN